MTEQETIATKIAKLLRKAESTDSPAEAEALFAKAQELMVKHTIDEMMIAVLRGEQPTETIVREQVEFSGIYREALGSLAYHGVVLTNGCRGVFTGGSKITRLAVIGFESDVRNVRLLVASLEIQALRAMKTWWESQRGQYAWMTAGEAYRSRREFIYGFAEGVKRQLQKGRDEGVATAAADQAKRAEVPVGEATQVVALALRDRKAQVDDWVDRTYGRLRYSHSTRMAGSPGARAAGADAGARADVNRPRVGGGRQALGGGR